MHTADLRFPKLVTSAAIILILAAVLVACQTMPAEPDPDPQQALIDRGRQLFFEETFAGNGRSCGTCHRADNNLGIDPAFIATLPNDDPLFVAEFVPALMENFENPRLMREFGLIIENLDGFDDLPDKFTMRGVPHTLALPTSIDSRGGPRLGWSGDGSPGDGTLKSFAIGAVIQHYPLSTNRIPGVDFRLPTEDELEALEAFMASQGRQEELELPLPLKGVKAARGQELFNSIADGKCLGCHFNAGANANPGIFGEGVGNMNFDTGVEAQPDQAPDLTGEKIPDDDGFGTPGDGTFNTPTLVEAADTPPFFHNNSVETLEGAVAFYNGDAFNNSAAGQLVAGATGGPINLDGTQVEAIAAFLRVINALESIRTASVVLTAVGENKRLTGRLFSEQLPVGLAEIDDAIMVLEDGGLHRAALAELREAQRLAQNAQRGSLSKRRLAAKAVEALQRARDDMIESS